MIITSQAIKARYLGQDEEHKTLMELFKYHYESQKRKLRPGTKKNYYGTEKYLKRIWEVIGIIVQLNRLYPYFVTKH